MKSVNEIEKHMNSVHAGVVFKVFSDKRDLQADIENDADVENADDINDVEEEEEGVYEDPAIARLTERVDELTDIIKSLVVAIEKKTVAESTPAKKSSTPNKGLFSSPSVIKKGATVKPQAISFNGVVDHLMPVGKILLAGSKIPTVVYEKGSKNVYYSPERSTDMLKERNCSTSQLDRLDELTTAEYDFLGYECN